jgi:starch phosphorylase
LNAVTYNRYYLEKYDRVMRQFDHYLEARQTWFNQNHPQAQGKTIAYFSMEFGLHETLAIYAGGLGVLSGDHLKEASDLGLPLVAVGLLYTEGYFSQRITEDGWQETRDYSLNLDEAPLALVLEGRQPLLISVELPGREVKARVWEVRVGRVPLYLLDTNVEQNEHADRFLTSRLYNSDQDIKISQRVLLGVGGTRALRAMGYEPTVWHLNEGHSAF